MQHCHNTYTRWSYWFHIHIIFSSYFYLIIVTCRNSLPIVNMIQVVIKKVEQLKAFFVLHGEVLTGLKHSFSFKKQLPRVFYKKSWSYKFSNIYRKTLVLESLFTKFAGLQAGNFITKRLQHRCVPVNIVKTFKNIYFKGHLWTNCSELYWFEVEEIIEKTEIYSETIIGDVFRTQWNI